MTRERYAQWMAVWKWFQGKNASAELVILYDTLNEMWQQDRQASTPEQLAAYSEPLDLENDADFRKFLSALDEGFSKGTK
jgi:hypothetical protein